MGNPFLIQFLFQAYLRERIRNQYEKFFQFYGAKYFHYDDLLLARYTSQDYMLQDCSRSFTWPKIIALKNKLQKIISTIIRKEILFLMIFLMNRR